mgnify:FL=1
MASFVLAIDQGTTGTTAALMDENGRVRAKANTEFAQIYPKPGWVEHSPDDIWKSVVRSVKSIMHKQICRPSNIVAIGITNQRETALLWDRFTSQPLNNAIVWQCRRTTDFCKSLKKSGVQGMVKRRSGLLLDPYFSGSKFRWLIKNTPGVATKLRKGRVIGGTIDSYLLWRLTGGQVHVTDVTNASRTSLMNLSSLSWDKELLSVFEIPRDILPRICASSGIMGSTLGFPGLPDGIPISGVAGDQQAALFGQTCFNVGDVKCTFGTGSFILMNTGEKKLQSKTNLLTTVAWQLEKDKRATYAIEGGAFVCGAAVQWIRDGLKFISKASDIERLANEVIDHNGVEFVPALTGLGAPHWSPEARGTVTGLTRGTERGHIARATLDAMALQNMDIITAMERDLGKRVKGLKVDGGASENNLLMQIQADVVGRQLIRPALTESTVAGACYLAGLGVELWKGKKMLREIWKADRVFKVSWPQKKRAQRIKSWRAAIQKTTLES